MTNIDYFFFEEIALPRSELQSCFSDTLEYFPQPIHMFVVCS